MSLESGRKLGLISSLLNVILPVVAVVATVFFIVSLFAALPSGTSPFAPHTFLFSGGLIALLIIMGIAGVISFILFIVAMYQLSHYYTEPALFKNIVYAIIINVVGAAVVLVSIFAFMLSSISRIAQPSTPSTVTPFLTQIIFSYLAVIAIAVVFNIVSAVLYMRAFNKLAEKSGVDSFKTAGLLYLIGAIPVVGVGGLISWIAWIFAAISFNKLKPSSTAVPPVFYPTQPPMSSTTQMKRCPSCGTENYPDALYCRTCGKPLQ